MIAGSSHCADFELTKAAITAKHKASITIEYVAGACIQCWIQGRRC